MRKEIKDANRALIGMYFDDDFFKIDLTDDEIKTLERIKKTVELALEQKKEAKQ